MSKVYTRFSTKTGQKPYPFGTAQTYMAYIREYNPRGMIQVSLRAFLQFTHCCLASFVTCWSASSFSWRQVIQYTFRYQKIMKTRDRKKNEKLIKGENALINQTAQERREHIPVHKQIVNEIRWQHLYTQKGVSYLVHGKRSFSAY